MHPRSAKRPTIRDLAILPNCEAPGQAAQPNCRRRKVLNADCRETGRLPRLKVVFARPLFEDHLIFRAQAITLLPNLFCIPKIEGDLVDAAE